MSVRDATLARRPFAWAALVLCGALGQGCASPLRDYPSIGPREGEILTASSADSGTRGGAPDAPAPPDPPTDLLPAHDSLARAQDAHRAFIALAAAASGPVAAARSAEAGSEAWAEGELALARLATSRSNTAGALATLDALVAQGLGAGRADPELEALRDRALRMIEEQDRLLQGLALMPARLPARLPAPLPAQSPAP